MEVSPQKESAQEILIVLQEDLVYDLYNLLLIQQQRLKLNNHHQKIQNHLIYQRQIHHLTNHLLHQIRHHLLIFHLYQLLNLNQEIMRVEEVEYLIQVVLMLMLKRLVIMMNYIH